MGETEAVLILSGGMDSTTLLYELLRKDIKVHALGFCYGQKHQIELAYAANTCKKLNVDYKIIDLSTLKPLLASALTENEAKIPHGHYAQENMIKTVVPNRNMIMLSIAAGIAASLSVDPIYVYTAVHAGDHAIYPDCRPDFINYVNSTLRVGLEGIGTVSVFAPFIHSSKRDIALMGDKLGVPWEDTWSCYEGGLNSKKHCGRCGTCVERLEALNGLKDNTEYEDKEFWKEVTSSNG